MCHKLDMAFSRYMLYHAKADNKLVFATYMSNKREKFLKIYANLPLGVRKEIILTLDDKPITWDVAFIEINNNTKISKIILEKLKRLDII